VVPRDWKPNKQLSIIDYRRNFVIFSHCAGHKRKMNGKKYQNFLEWSLQDYEQTKKQKSRIAYRAKVEELLELVNQDIKALERDIGLVDKERKGDIISVRSNPPYLKPVRRSRGSDMPFFIGSPPEHMCKVKGEIRTRHIDICGLVYPIWPAEQSELLSKLPLPKSSSDNLDEYYSRLSQILDGIPRSADDLRRKHLECHSKGVLHLPQAKRKAKWPLWTEVQDERLRKAARLFKVHQVQWKPVFGMSSSLVTSNSQDVQDDDGVHWVAVSRIIGRPPRQCRYRFRKIMSD
jgi:hypothetical protein